MTIVQLREKMHRVIDTAEDKKLKALYAIVEEGIK